MRTFLQRSRLGIGLFVLFVGITLGGCGTAVPLAGVEQAAPLDPALLGQWKMHQPNTADTLNVLVLPFDEKTYYVECSEHDDPDLLRLRGYITYLEGKPFLNLQHIGSADEEERTFFFFTYRFEGADTVVLQQLEDVGDVEIDAFTTTEALAAFVRTHLADARLYSEPGIFRRVAP